MAEPDVITDIAHKRQRTERMLELTAKLVDNYPSRDGSPTYAMAFALINLGDILDRHLLGESDPQNP